MLRQFLSVNPFFDEQSLSSSIFCFVFSFDQQIYWHPGSGMVGPHKQCFPNQSFRRKCGSTTWCWWVYLKTCWIAFLSTQKSTCDSWASRNQGMGVGKLTVNEGIRRSEWKMEPGKIDVLRWAFFWQKPGTKTYTMRLLAQKWHCYYSTNNSRSTHIIYVENKRVSWDATTCIDAAS